MLCFPCMQWSAMNLPYVRWWTRHTRFSFYINLVVYARLPSESFQNCDKNIMMNIIYWFADRHNTSAAAEIRLLRGRCGPSIYGPLGERPSPTLGAGSSDDVWIDLPDDASGWCCLYQRMQDRDGLYVCWHNPKNGSGGYCAAFGCNWIAKAMAGRSGFQLNSTSSPQTMIEPWLPSG